MYKVIIPKYKFLCGVNKNRINSEIFLELSSKLTWYGFGKKGYKIYETVLCACSLVISITFGNNYLESISNPNKFKKKLLNFFPP